MNKIWIEIQEKCLEKANTILDSTTTINTGLEGSVIAREFVETAIKIEEFIKSETRNKSNIDLENKVIGLEKEVQDQRKIFQNYVDGNDESFKAFSNTVITIKSDLLKISEGIWLAIQEKVTKE